MGKCMICGKRGLFLKVDALGRCNECAQKEREKEAAEAALKQAQAEIERLKAQQNQEEPKPEETLKVGETVKTGKEKYRQRSKGLG